MSVIYLPLLSIRPSCRLITYSIMSLRFLLARTPRAPPIPFLPSLSFIHLLSVSRTLILPLGVRMRFSLAASRSVFSATTADDASQLWKLWRRPRREEYRAGAHAGQGPASPFVGGGGVMRGHYVVLALLLECVCLFVYHHLSSTVTPPGPPLRSRSGPLWQRLF